MTIAIESKYWNENKIDYIHYYAKNNFNNLGNILNDEKNNLIANYYKKYNIAKENLTKGLNSQDAQLAESLLNGDIFKGSPVLSPKTVGKIPIDTKEAVKKALKDITNGVGGLQDISNAIGRLLESIAGAENNLVDAIAAYEIVKQRSKTSTVGMTNLGFKSTGNVSANILQAILGKHRQQAFQIPNSSTSINKLYAIKQLCENVKSLPLERKTYYVRHGDIPGATPVKGESAIIKELAIKVNKLIDEYDAVSLEAATLSGIEQVINQMEDQMKAIGKVIAKSSGTNQFRVSYSEDPKLQKHSEMLENEGVTLSSTTSKSDAKWIVSRNGVDTHIGFSVKKIEHINPNTQTVNIRLQSGTPLYTLLIRECGFSSNEMMAIHNLAAGHSDKNNFSDANLISAWNNVIDKVKKAALVSALTGFGLQGQSFYLVINKNIYTMEDVISNIQKQLYSSSHNTNIVLSEISKSNGNGLNRKTYVDQNIWQGEPKKGKNRELALERSNQTLQNNIQTMYKTKISISLNSFYLGKLAAIGQIS